MSKSFVDVTFSQLSNSLELIHAKLTRGWGLIKRFQLMTVKVVGKINKLKKI